MDRRFAVALVTLVGLAGSGCGDDDRPLPDPDAGAADAAAVDAARGDAAGIDAGRTDGGGPGTDAGRRDAGARDAGRDAFVGGCGDGIRAGAELCDDGNTTSGDGCTATCTLEGACDSAVDLDGVGTVAADGTRVVLGDNERQPSHGDGSCAPSRGGHDMVFRFDPPADGVAVFDTSGAETRFDTVLHARTTCVTATTEVACDDESGRGGASLIRAAVRAGTPLYVFVDAADASATRGIGTFELHVRFLPTRAAGAACDPTGATDLCATGLACTGAAGGSTCTAIADGGCGAGVAVVDLDPLLTGRVATYRGDTRTGTSFATGSCAVRGSTGGPEVVHHLRMPIEGFLSVDAPPSGFDGIIYARTACASSATELGCDRSTTLDLSSRAALAAGTDVYIFVDAASSGAGPYTLTVRVHPFARPGESCGLGPTDPLCGPTGVCRDESGTLVCRATVCGDGLVEGAEACDDHNTVGSDGCSATCTLEDQGMGGTSCATVRTLRLVATSARSSSALATGTTVGAGSDYGASCGSASGAEDVVYQLTLTDTRNVTFGVQPGASFDVVIYVRGGSGRACTDATGELGCQDGPGDGGYEDIVLPSLGPGTYYLFVDGFRTGTGSSGPYTLTVRADLP